jgi:hypothetical protein
LGSAISCCPAHAVLAMQLGGERPASQRRVEPLLGQPDRELPSRSKPSPSRARPRASWTAPEPVVGPANLAVHKQVTPVGVGGDDCDLDQLLVPDRADDFLGIGVRRGTRGEKDAHRVGSVRRCDPPEDRVRLGNELGVGHAGKPIAPPGRIDVRGGDLVGHRRARRPQKASPRGGRQRHWRDRGAAPNRCAGVMAGHGSPRPLGWRKRAFCAVVDLLPPRPGETGACTRRRRSLERIASPFDQVANLAAILRR